MLTNTRRGGYLWECLTPRNRVETWGGAMKITIEFEGVIPFQIRRSEKGFE